MRSGLIGKNDLRWVSLFAYRERLVDRIDYPLSPFHSMLQKKSLIDHWIIL